MIPDPDAAAIRFIVGLGNPDDHYRDTPHNLGRELVFLLQEQEGLRWKREKLYDWTDSKPAYVLPKTYMNASGEALARLLQQFRSAPAQALVCVDDFDLPFGAIRIRKKGSAGSHNGLRSIVEHVGAEFPRLRLGIGPIPPGEDPAAFVLRPLRGEGKDRAREMLERAAQALHFVLAEGLDAAMNRFNPRA